MQTPEDQRLAAEAESTLKAAVGLMDWVRHPANATTVASAGVELGRTLRREALAARRLAAAAARPPGVGVFGPSQAGKSYLVSQLARLPGSSLALQIGSGRYDFLSEINPPGNRESTGLVTRFCLRSSPLTDLPVEIRLLSQTDIVKILGNSFFLDFDVNAAIVRPLSAEAVQQRLDLLRARAGEAPTDTLDADDVFDVAEYFSTNFPGQTSHLAAEFWDQAMVLAPRLATNDRASLWSLLWSDFEPFTALYRELHAGLRQLRFATSAQVSIEALIPRETSIIDVQTLDRLGADTEDRLRVRPAGATGEVVEVARSLLCALTAELVAPLAEPPRSMFERADLLDFPGARSRFKLRSLEDVSMSKGVAEGANPLRELLLRGKIAYLFQRYTLDRELSSLVLCVADGNQEVRDLSDMVKTWVDQTHGATPAERVGSRKALFLVLTKMDREFETKAGDTGQSRKARWKARIDNSLVGNFRGGWPLDWDGGPFDNVFWLRNPEVLDEGRMQYRLEGNRQHEVSMHPAFASLVSEMKSLYLANTEVARHFADPQKAWDEAMKLNDGGVAYLVEKLSPLCDGETRRKQLRQALRSLEARLRSSMERFHVSGDIEERLARRRIAADAIIDQLYADPSRIGSILRALQLDFVDLRGHLHRVALRGDAEEGSAAPHPAAPAAPSVRPILAGSGQQRPTLARPGAPSPGARVGEVVSSSRTVAQVRKPWPRFAAEATLSLWRRQIVSLSEDEGACVRLGISREVGSRMVSELLAAARREDLLTRIELGIGKVVHLDPDLGVAKAAIVGMQHINRFVSELGNDRLDARERPTIEGDGPSRPVFQPREIVHDIAGWPEESPPFEAEYAQSWAFSFYAVVEANARSEAGLFVDVEQNAQLGRLLDSLAVEAHGRH